MVWVEISAEGLSRQLCFPGSVVASPAALCPFCGCLPVRPSGRCSPCAAHPARPIPLVLWDPKPFPSAASRGKPWLERAAGAAPRLLVTKRAGSARGQHLGCGSAGSPGVKPSVGRGLALAERGGGSGEAFFCLAGVRALQTPLASKRRPSKSCSRSNA